MKPLVLFLLAGLLSLFSFAESGDLLVLRSGAILQGRFLGMQEARITFQPRWSETAVVLPLRDMKAVFFGESAESDSGGLPGHRIEFRDGDRLSGRIFSRGEDTIRMEVNSEISVTVLSAAVQTIETFPSETDLLLEEPMAFDRWQGQGMPGMAMARVQLGAGNVMPAQAMAALGFPMQARGDGGGREGRPLEVGGSWFFGPGEHFSVFRALPDLPERFRLSYAVRSLGGAFMMNVGAFTRQPFSRGAGGMLFTHQNSHMHGQAFSEQPDPATGQPGTANFRENLEIPDLQWHRIELYVDRVKHRAWMYVNGVRLQEWDMVFESGAVSGRWISLQGQHSVEGIQLTELYVSHWDGNFPGRQLESFPAESPTALRRARRSREAELRMRSQTDRLTLRVLEITQTSVIADGEGFEGVVEIPRRHLLGLHFPWMAAPGGTDGGLSIDLDTPQLPLRMLPGERP